MKDVFTVLPTGFGKKSHLSQLFFSKSEINAISPTMIVIIPL